jgi:hypothetical protein
MKNEEKWEKCRYLRLGIVRWRWRNWVCVRFFSIRPQLVGVLSRGWSLRSGNQWLSCNAHVRSDVSFKTLNKKIKSLSLYLSYLMVSISSSSIVLFIITLFKYILKLKRRTFVCFYSTCWWIVFVGQYHDDQETIVQVFLLLMKVLYVSKRYQVQIQYLRDKWYDRMVWIYDLIL